MPKTTEKPIEYNEDKFRELFLYVSARLAGDPSNGSVKANKAMFFSDFVHYAVTGKPITGVEYVHRRLGPAPKGLTTLLQELIKTNQADQVIVMNGPRAQKMVFPKREPDLSKFDALEVSVVEQVLEALKTRTAEEASEMSHTWLGWKLTQEGETIPYHWALMYDGPIPEETFEYAEKLTVEVRQNAGSAA